MSEEKNTKENISENKVLLNDEDINAAGGYTLTGSTIGGYDFDLTGEELRALKAGGFIEGGGGFIVDGKLKNKDCEEAIKYLESNGFEGRFYKTDKSYHYADIYVRNDLPDLG